ncbi:hypothetical protein [Ideonella sp.]|uniref:hypothetical protein n=1 Tax=Ideonella sp. TaxID=1929293 RepID=UPI002B487D20|nr:hypothetical protein [Ideonella sp.]HJV71489.1 hypothetical protein [Ideonella sp.]
MANTPAKPYTQVGASDPDRETSPIIDDEEDLEAEPNVANGMCYFNGEAFRLGDRVLSGSEVLRCEAPGVWVREGERVEFP